MVERFKAQHPGRYSGRLALWGCPFLPDVEIVGLFEKGVVGIPAGPNAFAVTDSGIESMYDFIRRVAEDGWPGFDGSAKTSPYSAALLVAYLSADERNVILIEPQGVERVNEDGIAAEALVEVAHNGEVFEIMAYTLDEENMVSVLKISFSSSSGEMLSFNLEATNVGSAPKRVFM